MNQSSKVAAFVMAGLVALYLVGYLVYRGKYAVWATSPKLGSEMLIKRDTREQRMFARLYWPCLQAEELLQRYLIDKQNVPPSP